MTNDVIIKVKGIQKDSDRAEENVIESICFGQYYERNNKLYLKYDEELEGIGQVNNLIKIDNDQVEIYKKGVVGNQMIFREGDRSKSCYQTPYGDMIMDICTDRLYCELLEDSIDIQIEYNVWMNEMPFSKASVHINVTPRAKGIDLKSY